MSAATYLSNNVIHFLFFFMGTRNHSRYLDYKASKFKLLKQNTSATKQNTSKIDRKCNTVYIFHYVVI